MKDAARSLQELKDALGTLSPQDFTAWNEWMEGRLTARLRRRKERNAPPDTPRPDGEETPNA